MKSFPLRLCCKYRHLIRVKLQISLSKLLVNFKVTPQLLIKEHLPSYSCHLGSILFLWIFRGWFRCYVCLIQAFWTSYLVVLRFWCWNKLFAVSKKKIMFVWFDFCPISYHVLVTCMFNEVYFSLDYVIPNRNSLQKKKLMNFLPLKEQLSSPNRSKSMKLLIWNVRGHWWFRENYNGKENW